MATGTPVLIEGFDLYDDVSAFTASGKWNNFVNNGSPPCFSLLAGGRFGQGNALRLNSVAATCRLAHALPALCNRVQVGFAFRLNAMPVADRRFATLICNLANTSCRLQVKSDGKLRLNAYNSAFVESVGSLALNEWVWIEWVAYVNNTFGTHKIYVNGVEWISFGPSDTTPASGSQYWASVVLGSVDDNLSLDAAIDDLVVANNTGNPTPDLFGDSRVSVLQPTAVAVNVGFAASGAGTIAGALNGTAPANDTSYVEAENVDDSLYVSTSETLPSNVGVIHAIGLNLRHRKTAAGPREILPGLRIGATEFPADDTVVLGESLSTSQTIFAQNPDTAAAWLKTEIETTEFGLKITT